MPKKVIIVGTLDTKGAEHLFLKQKIEENVLSEIMEVVLQEAMESGKVVKEVDTTNKDPEDAAKEIVKVIEEFVDLKNKGKENKD